MIFLYPFTLLWVLNYAHGVQDADILERLEQLEKGYRELQEEKEFMIATIFEQQTQINALTRLNAATSK